MIIIDDEALSLQFEKAQVGKASKKEKKTTMQRYGELISHKAMALLKRRQELQLQIGETHEIHEDQHGFLKGMMQIEPGHRNMMLEGELSGKWELIKTCGWIGRKSRPILIKEAPGFSIGQESGPQQAPLTPLKILSWNCRGLGKT